jgi:hypothetical protein
MLCASCKNKNSNEQCTSNVLRGFIFCGKHLKVKKKRIWSDVSPNRHEATLIQKIWRGYLVRKLIKFAGEGVLKRSLCHNEEELVTMEAKNKQDPLSYFSINESGKIYWFDICSINQWIRTNTTNPYTRQVLTIDDRIRLREMCRMRRKMYLTNLHQSDHSLASKWLEICQIIEENGFFDMNHLFFQNLGRSALHDFMMIILQDLTAYAGEHSKKSRRYLYVEWVKNRIETFRKNQLTTVIFSEKVANTLLSILYDCLNNYTVCFIIVSARCRL